MKKYIVMVHCFPCADWIFSDFDGGTQKEAEKCADYMNLGDSAKQLHYRYYATEEK